MNISPKVKQTIFASAPLLSTLISGMMYGYPTFLIPALLNEEGDDLKAHKHLLSWIASLPGFSGAVAVVAVGPLMHYCGRKKTHLIINIFILIGWILISIAHSIPTLIAGRALQGISTGSIFFYSMFIGEYTCPTIRGILLNMKLCFVSIGILLIHIFGFYLNWRSLALLPILPLLVTLIILIVAPESPDWLVSRGRFMEAENVFFSLRGYSLESEREIRQLINEEKRRKTFHAGNSLINNLKHMRSKALWRPVIILCCARLVPEVGGRHFFPTYSLQLVEQITGHKSKGFLYTILIDLTSLIAAVISNYFVVRFQRRHLMFYFGYSASFLLMVSCMFMYISSLYKELEILRWLSFTTLGVYFMIMVGSTFGVCYILMGEMMPLDYRAIGTVLDGVLSCLIVALVLKMIPILTELIEVHGMLFVFAVVMVFTLTYMYFDMPESKDRTLQDIGDYFKGKSPKIRYNDEIDDEERKTMTTNT